MRLPKLPYEKYTPRQKEVADKHTARRDTIGGPYNVWIHSPELFEKASAISNYMRFDCGLPGCSSGTTSSRARAARRSCWRTRQEIPSSFSSPGTPDVGRLSLCPLYSAGFHG